MFLLAMIGHNLKIGGEGIEPIIFVSEKKKFVQSLMYSVNEVKGENFAKF